MYNNIFVLIFTVWPGKFCILFLNIQGNRLLVNWGGPSIWWYFGPITISIFIICLITFDLNRLNIVKTILVIHFWIIRSITIVFGHSLADYFNLYIYFLIMYRLCLHKGKCNNGQLPLKLAEKYTNPFFYVSTII